MKEKKDETEKKRSEKKIKNSNAGIEPAIS